MLFEHFQNSWYPSISPRDRTFLPAVHALILTFLRSLFLDISRDDVLDTVLIKLPMELTRHVSMLRMAKKEAKRIHTDFPQYQGQIERENLVRIFQRLCPHPGVIPTLQDMNGDVQLPPIPGQDVILHADENLDDTLADAMASSIIINGTLPNHMHEHPPQLSGTDTMPTTSSSHPLDIPLRVNKPYPTVDSAEAAAISIPRIKNPDPPNIPHAFPPPIYQISPHYLACSVDSLLRAHLPPQDYKSSLERSLVTEIIANAVLGNVLKKISYEWFWWRLGISFLEKNQTQNPSSSIEPGKCRYDIIYLFVRLAAILRTFFTVLSILASSIYSLATCNMMADDDDKRRRNPRRVAQRWIEFAGEVLRVDESQTKTEVWRLLSIIDGLTYSLIDRLVPIAPVCGGCFVRADLADVNPLVRLAGLSWKALPACSTHDSSWRRFWRKP